MANPTLLTMPLCVNADKNTIPATDAGTSGLFSEEYGWQNINSLPLASGGKAPNRRDFNGVFALLGGIAYACQRGYTFTWDATQDYEVGCVVLDTNDNKRYECISDVTANATPPSADTTHWQAYGEVDISGKANTNLDNLTQTGEDHFLAQDFTIIYPNGGTESNPANVTSNSRYVETNPFDGYEVMCRAEIKYNDKWASSGEFVLASGGKIGVGIGVWQYDGNIIVQTGSNAITTNSNQTGNPIGNNSFTVTTAPCRVKVWKIGKIPT